MTTSRIAAVLVACLSLNACLPAAVGSATTAGVAAGQERTMGNALDDATIKAQIESSYIQKDVNNLFHDVTVKVSEGRVLLTGAVQKPESRVEAVRLAWQPWGVREVINEIQIVAASTDSARMQQFATDVYITTQIKALILFDKYIKSINYSVDTVNGVVYLMGIAQDEHELKKVTNYASRTRHVKKVVSHVRLKDKIVIPEELHGNTAAPATKSASVPDSKINDGEIKDPIIIEPLTEQTAPHAN